MASILKIQGLSSSNHKHPRLESKGTMSVLYRQAFCLGPTVIQTPPPPDPFHRFCFKQLIESEILALTSHLSWIPGLMENWRECIKQLLVFKYWTIRQHRTQFLRRVKHMRQSLQFPELTAKRQFPTHSTEKGELKSMAVALT